MTPWRRAAILWLALLGAPCALARPEPAAPLSPDEQAAFAARLESAVVSRLQLLPGGDAELEQLATCAVSVAPVRVTAFREPRAVILSLPTGLILVSSGLVHAASTDAELSSALAHAAGHVARQDILRRLEHAYGSARLRAIAAGSDGDMLATMATNLARDGVLARHSTLAESAADDAARAAGCASGGLPRILERAAAQLRRRKRPPPAHPGGTGSPSLPFDASPAADGLSRLRAGLGAVE